MNKGLDSEFSDIYKLPKKDLNYGKMALFDYTCFHWDTDNTHVIKLMQFCSKILFSFPELKNFNNFKLIKIKHDYVTAYTIPFKKGYFLFVINTNMVKNYKIKFSLWFTPSRIHGILSSYFYYRKNIFFHSKVLKRINQKKNIVNIKIKKSEILILQILPHSYLVY